jgi:hypothetical protein
VGVAFRLIVPRAAGAAAATGPSAVGIVTLFPLVSFIVCFAFSMGPVTWTVINEVSPGAHPRPGRSHRYGMTPTTTLGGRDASYRDLGREAGNLAL